MIRREPDLGLIPHPFWDTRRAWSLAEMINYGLNELFISLQFLDYELGIAQANSRDMIVDEEQHSRLKNNIEKGVLPAIRKLRMSDLRIANINLSKLLNNYERIPYTYGELADSLKRLKGDFLESARYECFFHYKKSAVQMLRPVVEGFEVNSEWKKIVDAFPSAKREVETGLDCYAFGDLSGCVFHMMRIAELGLRAIARERGIKKVGRNKPLEWGTWKEVSDAIRKQIDQIKGKPAGSGRDAALAFYETALDKMRLMQALYRDPTMHFRENYSQGETYDAVFNTNSFMNVLVDKLDEAHPNKKIRWRF